MNVPAAGCSFQFFLPFHSCRLVLKSFLEQQFPWPELYGPAFYAQHIMRKHTLLQIWCKPNINFLKTPAIKYVYDKQQRIILEYRVLVTKTRIELCPPTGGYEPDELPLLYFTMQSQYFDLVKPKRLKNRQLF